METVGPAALAACRRGLAPAGHHPRSWLGWDLAGWQLHATPAVRAVSVALCIAFVAKASTLSAPIHGLTRSTSSPSKVSLSLKEPLRTPVPSQPVSLPTPALVWSGPARALPCVCLPGRSGWLLPGRASGPRLPSSHHHSSHRAPRWRDRRSENACLSENYDPVKHPLREVMACGGAGPEHPSCAGTKHSCTWGSVLELERGPGAGMQRRVLQEGSQRRAPEQDTAGPGPRAPRRGHPMVYRSGAGGGRCCACPGLSLPFVLPYIQRFIFYIGCNLQLGRSHQAPGGRGGPTLPPLSGCPTDTDRPSTMGRDPLPSPGATAAPPAPSQRWKGAGRASHPPWGAGRGHGWHRGGRWGRLFSFLFF